MLLQIKNVLTADELLQARSIISEAPWIDGRESAGK